MVRFADHTFETETGELAGPGGGQRLQPKPSRLLRMLLEADGGLVERDAIRDALWPETHVDFDAGLNTCVRQIRAALDACGGDPEWIETLPKRGYRMTVRVEPAARGRRAAAVVRPRYGLLFLAILAMLAAAVSGWQLAGGSAAVSDAAAAPRARLAVLPFDDPDSELDDPFNRALTEAFVVALTNIDPSRLVVIGPATTGSMMASGMTPAQVAARTNCAFVLSGGHRESDHLTFVQLIAEPGAEHLFAQRFAIDENAPAAAPAELVSAIAAAITSQLGR